jgi:hypothetical protein
MNEENENIQRRRKIVTKPLRNQAAWRSVVAAEMKVKIEEIFSHKRKRKSLQSKVGRGQQRRSQQPDSGRRYVYRKGEEKLWQKLAKENCLGEGSLPSQ